jgi:hypothetical protein
MHEKHGIVWEGRVNLPSVMDIIECDPDKATPDGWDYVDSVLWGRICGLPKGIPCDGECCNCSHGQ